MISPFRSPHLTLKTFKRWVVIAVMIFAGHGGVSAFTTNDAATSFTAFNTAFMSGGAYSGWWTGAELLEMAQDAYDNSPTTARRNIVTSTCNGFLSQNGSTWTGNEYNDDISWACIAFARAYLITGNMTYRDIAKANWDAMYNRAWDTNYFGGGLWWRQSDRQSKNACIQGPATIAACYLYNISGDTNYLNKAQAIYAWNRKYLFNTNSGAVSDNINTNGTVDTVALTYNQGTFIGSANLLHRATGLPFYYQDAILAGKRTQNNMTTAGVLPEWGSNSDLSGFNGIFIRWMGRFAKEQNLWAAFGPWLGTNANSAWSIRNTNNLSWQKWRTQTPDVSSEVANWGCSAAVIALQVADPSPGDSLQITPAAGFTAVTEARRFPAANGTVLTLTNTGGAALNWSLSNTSAWLTVSANSGVLNVATAADVTVNLATSVVTNLPAGRYFANVALTNVTTGSIAQRIFTLVIAAGDAPILTTGQNAKILAPNTATSGAPEATSFDLPNSYTFFQAGLGSSTRGLPPDGVFTSQWDKKTVFQFKPYGSSNTLVVGYTYPNSATLTLTTPQAYKSLTILACSANGSGSGTFVLNFTNGTTSPALSFNAQDWFGTTANVAIQAIGRLKLTGTFGPEDNGAINPNLYQTTIDLAAIGQDKPIASITFTKPAGAGAQQTTGIFALSGTVAYREPVITQQPAPANLFRFAGTTNTWTVGANAGLPVFYQWQKNGANIPDATNATFKISGLQTNDTGSYSVIVSNAFGIATSSNAALTVAPAATYPLAQAILTNNPLGYWRLDETSGTVARDYAANNNGTYGNTQLGQAGNKLIDPHTVARFGFLATSNSCVTNINLDFATSGSATFSIEAWVNGGTQTSDAGLVTKGYGSGGEQFNLDCGGTSHAFRFFVRDANGSAKVASSSVTPNNQWHHLVGVCDQVNGFVRLYVDGVQAAQGTLTPNTGILGSTATVSIGSRQAGVGTAFNNQFAGYMEEVAIYGYALSASQILTHYQAATNRAPVFVSNPFTLTSANAGQSYSGTLATSASDPNADSITFAKLSGPAWLSVASNGSLSGTPFTPNVGTNSFLVRATDPSGLATQATLNLGVIGAAPIVLTASPQENALVLSWVGGIAPYQVEAATNPSSPAWQNFGLLISSNTLTAPATNEAMIFRVRGQ